MGVGLFIIGLAFVFAPPALAQGDPAATPTRVGSIFDQPAQATQPPASASATPVPTLAATASPAPAAAATATRVGSIFDAPAQQPPPTATTASASPTRVGSIFDAPAQVQPTATTGGRVGSIFDTPAQATPAPGAGTGTVGSIFDQAQPSTIRFDGDGVPPSREYCLSCHSSPYLQMTLASGEVISVGFDEEAYATSVHGEHGTSGYLCVRCHVGMNEYPHPEVTATTARELTIEFSNACSRCHTDMYDETLDGAHFTLLSSGNQNAAVCSDCHGAHDVQALSDPQTGHLLESAPITSVQMCAECHSEIYARYAESTHGAAVLAGSQDAATCSDCHGVHSTEGPQTVSTFKLFSPDLCASCHADVDMMAKYDISTDVFSSYVADFHGTTTSIFQHTAPGQNFNSPVCVDCHGVHNIVSIEAENSPLLKENLLTTCQRCHPGASANFPDAWMSHYAPSLERTPITTIVTLAYTIMIPAVIGGLGLFVLTDIRRRRSKRDEEHDDVE